MVDLFFSILAIGLLFNLSWFFGRQILEGPGFIGNDSDYALSLISWFGRWWPRTPFWYPLQGAGVSLFHSYPILSTYLIIWLNRVINLPTSEIFRVISFLVFPITAVGIYFFARRKIGNQMASLMAGVFFLLSEASWVFQRMHGIFAQSFSMIFVPWGFLFFDLFLERKFRESKDDFMTRLIGLLAIIFTGLTFLSHVVTGTVTALCYVAYALIYSQIGLPLKTEIKSRLNRVIKVIYPTGFCLIFAVALVSFWLIPFYSYNRLANRDGLQNMGLNQLQEVSLLPRTLSGFGDFATGDLRYDYFFFALPVVLLSTIGLVGSLFTNWSVFGWGLVAFGMAIFTGLPLYLPLLVNLFRYIFTAVYFRALIATIILLPISAGFGAFILMDWPFRLIEKKISDKQPIIIVALFQLLKWLTVTAGVLLISLFFIVKFEHRPPDKATRVRPAYGITAFQAYGPTLGDGWNEIKKDWRVLLKRPEVKIASGEVSPAPSLIGFIRDFSLNKTNRVDVSAYSGESFLQRAPIITEATFVNLYHYFASLIHRMWGYQQGVFYGHEAIYNNPELLKELSYWFGIQYTVIVPGFDREANYQKVGWELVKPIGTDNPLPVYHFPEADGLLTVTNRPVALVIGSFKSQAYDQVFRSSNAGALPYKDVWLAEGSDKIDDYTLAQLVNFDLVILHGYSYGNKSKAWSLLTKYLDRGGRVFVDTGWQYTCSDWGKAKGGSSLPEPFPVKQTSWGNLSSSWTSLKVNPTLGEFDFDQFKPFLWDGGPWGAASASETDLRSGAEALIEDQGRVVVAKRDFGKGKIVWSGVNLFSHAQGPEGEKEIGVLKAIFNQLIDKKEDQNTSEVTWERDFPDNLTIRFTKETSSGWLLWREAFTPNWRITISDSQDKIAVYRGGPGFVLIKLPEISAGTTLHLDYHLRFFEGTMAQGLSAITVVFLFIYLFFGGKITKMIKNKFEGRFSKHVKKMTNSITEKEDNDY